jgi:hypothetical protein
MDCKRLVPGPRSSLVRRLLGAMSVDFAPTHQPPSVVLVGVATVAAITGSLFVDAVLVALGTRAFPSTRGMPTLCR